MSVRFTVKVFWIIIPCYLFKLQFIYSGVSRGDQFTEVLLRVAMGFLVTHSELLIFEEHLCIFLNNHHGKNDTCR